MRKVAEEAKEAGDPYQRATKNGFDAIARSWDELNNGFQAIATEVTDYSKKAFSDASHAFEQIVGARSFGQAIEIQSHYTKKTYENHMAEVSKLSQMYVSLMENAYKRAEHSASERVG